MLNIKSILEFVKDGVVRKDARFVIEDDEHLLDKNTGVAYHVYDSWFKVSQDGDAVITADDFTPEEKEIVWEIKKAITTPEDMKQKELNYKALQKSRRECLSDLYEFPTPAHDKTVEPEDGAEIYKG